MTQNSKLSIEKTEDGSYTLIKDGNRMHTKQGALKESIKKYVEPMLKHVKKQNNEKIEILDIGTGIGYNALLTKKKAEKNNIEPKIDTIDKKDYSEKIENIKSNQLTNLKNINSSEISFYKEDAREFIKNTSRKNKEKYHAIYLDPFPPKENPELYSVHFLDKLRKLLREDGLLITYNASYACRSGLVFSGFEISSINRMGRQMTIATKKKFEYPDLNKRNEVILGLTDIGIPYIDPNLNWSRNRMKKVRWNLRKKARHNKILSSSNKCPFILYNSTESREKDLNKFNINKNDLKKLVDVKGTSSEKILKMRQNILSFHR